MEKINDTAIFKKEDKSIMLNCLPASFTSVVRKIFKSIIAKNIRDHFD